MDEGGSVPTYICTSVRNMEGVLGSLEMDMEVLKCREMKSIKGGCGLLTWPE